MKNGIKNAVIVTLAGGIVALTAECIEQHHEINRKRNTIINQRKKLADLREENEMLEESFEKAKSDYNYAKTKLQRLVKQNLDALHGTVVLNNKTK